MKRTVVLNVAGLSPSLLGADTPHINGLAGGLSRIQPVCPAVTCTMQATFLTGRLPAQHGIVGNGWYFRELAEVFFWRQSNRLMAGEKIWQVGRTRNPAFTCANSFWWYNMVTDADWSVTPRPVYCADGRKLPDCYTQPPYLRQIFTRRFGTFPLFRFWGPATSIISTSWIAEAAMMLENLFSPVLHLVYLPHLDYILQKQGPGGAIREDLRQLDDACGLLIDFFRNRGCRVIILSEYGISAVDRPIHPNRVLREAGLLAVKTDLGREYLDAGASRAFAVADHQVAHVYVRDQGDIPGVRDLFDRVPGVEYVLDSRKKKEWGLGHGRAGELVLVANKGSWFSYYFWLNDDKAPDYARTVNIHAKPGYDPCELFFDPELRFPALTAGLALCKQRLGLRSLMEVIPLDARLVKGSHGRITEDPGELPLLLSSEPHLLCSDLVAAQDVFHAILDHIFSE